MSNSTRAYIQKEIDQRTFVDWARVRPSTKVVIDNGSYPNGEGRFIAYYKGFVIVDIDNMSTVYVIEPKRCRLAEPDCQWK